MSFIDKASIRHHYLAERQAIDSAYAKTASLELAAHLLHIIPAQASVVAAYRAMRGEINLSPALIELAARGHTLCLPVVETPHQPLFFRRWQLGQPLEAGAYGIDIPPADEPSLIPHCVIVPIVAFDKNGNRLGYGAGYYDRTIQWLRRTASDIQILGAAFASQCTEAIPAEAHDEKLDAIVTEKGILTF